MRNSIHPSLLFKRVLARYLSTFVPPGSSEEVGPMFGADVGIPVVPDEERNLDLEASGPDVEVWEKEPPVELAEGAGIWKISIGLALNLPVDTLTEEAEQLSGALWKCLVDEYDGDVSGGGDMPGPLAGRLTAMSAAMTDEDQENFPRVLCVGDVWGVGREVPAREKSRIINLFTLTAIAEVMPAGFSPNA